MAKDKIRLDVLLYEKGLTESREKARALIMSRIVWVDNNIIDKPGTKIDKEAEIQIKGNKLKYVSRGGLKLEKALSYFKKNVKNLIAVDIGASTGGFTDCLLQSGVGKVYAIDVGYGQLAWKLRQDSRVIPIERTNIRYVKREMLGNNIQLATIDVSFISLIKIMQIVNDLLTIDGEIICLIKPQFEAGKNQVGKKGVVKDPEIHKEVIKKICSFCITNIGLVIKNLTYSPIKGPEGNIEYLLYLSKIKSSMNDGSLDKIISSVVQEAHEVL